MLALLGGPLSSLIQFVKLGERPSIVSHEIQDGLNVVKSSSLTDKLACFYM